MTTSDKEIADENAAKIEAAVQKKKRSQRPFPACSFEEALQLAAHIIEFGVGKPVRRLTLFDHIGKSPDSGPSRQWITNANKYGLIKGNYTSEQLEITSDGAKAVDEELPQRDQIKARVKLAVQNIEPFKKLYERFAGNKLPPRAALVDAIKEFEVPVDLAEEAVDTFIVNQ